MSNGWRKKRIDVKETKEREEEVEEGGGRGGGGEGREGKWRILRKKGMIKHEQGRGRDKRGKKE